MPYYSAGDYYRGDGRNYAAGGIFGTIGKFLGGVAKTVVKASPIGKLAEAALPSVFGPKPAAMSIPYQPMSLVAPPPIPVTPVPGIKGTLQRLVPGGATGYEIAPDGTVFRARRRRINVTNVKALRRAGRRVRGFLKLASRLGALPVTRGKSKKLFRRKSR